MKRLILLIFLLGGCAFLPYQYNPNLTAEENAFYAAEHARNAQRAAAGLRQWSYNQQQLELQKRQGGNSSTTRCRKDTLGNIICHTNEY